MRGREVLKLGLVRIVGDGCTTKIFGDPWVTNLEDKTLHPRSCGLDFNANVSLKETWGSVGVVINNKRKLFETVLHAIIGCEVLHQFWTATKLPFVNERDEETNWLNAALTQWAPKEFELFAMTAQRVWERRNKIRLGESVGDIHELWKQSCRTWNEIYGSNMEKQRENSVDTIKKWQPPSWRCNGKEAYCAIAEALAIYEGLVFASRMSILNIVVEGDSTRVIKLLNEKGVEDNKEVNKVAYILVHDHVNFTSDDSSTQVWLEDYPSLICNALRSDISH
ncbi:uncharacterized protein G2W53_028662 [Senna tora]|uniref:RNase H type-1 domain-containing protein n=1 Tax=Senna tora TaxID=362788 RepID=A0A834T3S0_9FABA|nr:uncharacterized protein G2W53_028662 [Senna tora]